MTERGEVTRERKRPEPPIVVWEWYSLCSAHSKYEQTCHNCNAGRWISEDAREFDNWLWTYSPRIWRKWANRHNVSGWREWMRKNVWAKLEAR